MSQDRVPGFSEIMWFKKGETDAEHAEVAARSGGEVDRPAADTLPIEDRYRDDGSLTGGDHHRWSLRTGSTRQVPSLAATAARRGLSERALIAELDRARLLRLAIACALGVGAVLAFMVLR